MNQEWRKINVNDRDRLVAAERLRRITYAISPSDFLAQMSIFDFWEQNAVSHLCTDRSAVFSAMFLAKWAHMGFPVIRFGHRLAASLMATKLSDDIKSFLLPPWRAFEIHLPEPLPIVASDGSTAPGEVITAMWTDGIDSKSGEAKDIVSIMLRSSVDGLNLYSYGPIEYILNENEKKIGAADPNDFFALSGEPLDEKSMLLASRVAIGACIELSDPRALQKSKRGKSHGRSQRHGLPPEPRVYELNRPVKLDVRDAVRSFLKGGGKRAPTVQSMARGHWKQQAHGPRHTLRKLIHIEPYWRGPELSPINAKV